MKKILGLGALSTVGTVSLLSVVSCGTPSILDIRHFANNELLNSINQSLTSGEKITINQYIQLVNPILEDFVSKNLSEEIRDVEIRDIYYSYFDEDGFQNDRKFLLDSSGTYDFTTFNYSLVLDYDQYDNELLIKEGFAISRIRDEIEFERNDTINYVYSEVLDEFSETLIDRYENQLRNKEGFNGVSGLFSLNDFDIKIFNSNKKEITEVSQLERKSTKYNVTLKNKETSKVALAEKSFDVYIERD
ncbi:hypothetical protein FQR65_LT19330 [Abscondita terminalis]|nr:hypothetical protein FQR65_LT19330 [Abscondita terminalis]